MSLKRFLTGFSAGVATYGAVNSIPYLKGTPAGFWLSMAVAVAIGRGIDYIFDEYDLD